MTLTLYSKNETTKEAGLKEREENIELEPLAFLLQTVSEGSFQCHPWTLRVASAWLGVGEDGSKL